MLNKVSAFLRQNNLLDSNQFGFRSGHSTETALLSVVEALRLPRADSKSSILTLLDLFAAFDTVNHQILLSTLMVKGISGTALQTTLLKLPGPADLPYTTFLHWLPIAARIKFKALMFAYKTTTGSGSRLCLFCSLSSHNARPHLVSLEP